MEAKLSLAAKQDQPSLAAVAGGYGSAKRSHGHTAGGHFPYARGGGNAGRGNNGGRGNNAARGDNGRGCPQQYSASCPAVASPAQGANSEPLGDRIVNNVGKTAGATPTKQRSPDQCTFCNIAGHNIHDCRKLKKLKAETPQSQDVSFSTSAYLSACAVHEADACLSSSSPATHAGTYTLFICLTFWQASVRR